MFSLRIEELKVILESCPHLELLRIYLEAPHTKMVGLLDCIFSSLHKGICGADVYLRCTPPARHDVKLCPARPPPHTHLQHRRTALPKTFRYPPSLSALCAESLRRRAIRLMRVTSKHKKRFTPGAFAQLELVETVGR